MSTLIPITGHRLPGRVRRQLTELTGDALVVAEEMVAAKFLHQTGMILDTDTHRLGELLSRGDPIHASRMGLYLESQTITNLGLIGRWAFRQ